jgi:hypothetical protein
MDLHANPLDPRSHPTSPSFTYLRVLLSASTSSVAGLLMLGENPAFAYPLPTIDESTQLSAIDHTSNQNDAASIEIPESVADSESDRDLYEFDLSHQAHHFISYEAEIAQEESSENEIHFVRSALVSELQQSALESAESRDVEISTVDFTDASLQTYFQTEDAQVDWVAWFDHVQAIDGESPEKENPTSIAQSLNEFDTYETRAESLLSEPLTAQTIDQEEEDILLESEEQPIASFEPLTLNLQGVYLLEGGDSSARARLSGSYAFTPNVLLGTTIDLTTGDGFAASSESGFDLNELFVTVSPSTVPSLRFTLGMIDLTSYFDRNSFAKDAATHFFNPVFQTNPALASAGLGSRPGVMVNWDVTDHLILRGAAFSSDRDLGEFAFDAAAAEVGVRLGNAIIRGTYVNSRDAGRESGFQEIFQFDRGNDTFGILPNDREVAYGVNAEYFIPEINLGLFARYGWYENQTLGRNGNTYSFGVNVLDLFFADDRLGIAYGRDLSNNSLRRRRGDEIPDVFEAFYDVRLTRNLRAGVSLQGRDAWSETVLGLRVRADLDLAGLWR